MLRHRSGWIPIKMMVGHLGHFDIYKTSARANERPTVGSVD